MSRALKGGLFKALLLLSLAVGFLMLVVLLVVTSLQVIGTSVTQFISQAAAGVGGA